MISPTVIRVALAGLVGLLMATQAFAAPVLSFTVTGPEQTVYSYQRDKCDSDDVPDAAVRAFKDSKGTVHLIAAAPLNRALVGPDLDHVKKSCNVVYHAGTDPDPSHFDDEG